MSESTSEPGLFGDLPIDQAPLNIDDAAFLQALPVYPSLADVDDETTARRLERKGLVKIHRWKDDPVAHRPTFCVGRLP